MVRWPFARHDDSRSGEVVAEQIENAVLSDDAATVARLLQERPHLINHFVGIGGWLHLAAKAGSLSVLHVLTELGMDVDAPSDAERPNSRNPLGNAISSGNVAAVRFLLEKGANASFDRPVISAIVSAKSSNLEIVKLLEAHGADLQREFTHSGTGKPMNALSTAVDWGKDDVAEYLRSRGCTMPGGRRESQPAPDDSEAGQIVRYFAEAFGKVEKISLSAIVPMEPPITIHAIRPTSQYPCVTLFTTGMSASPMKLPRDADQNFQYAELFMQLPADWKYQSITDPAWGWPMLYMQWLANYPHANRTWMGGPVTIASPSDPPTPLVPDLPFTCLLALAERQMTTLQGKVIQFYRLMPLYTEERTLEIERGIAALMQAFDRKSIGFVFDPKRPNAAD